MAFNRGIQSFRPAGSLFELLKFPIVHMNDHSNAY